MKPITFLKHSKVRFSLALERFREEAKGVAAVEFAIIAPVLILMFIGTLEISLAIAVNRKVSRISSTVADLVTQSQSLTSSDIDAIMDVSSKIMYPYKNDVGIIITGIEIDSNSNATVDWSQARLETAKSNGAPYSVPTKILTPDTFLVSAVVKASHTPMIGWIKYNATEGITFDGSAMEMEEELFLRPRIGSKVERN